MDFKAPKHNTPTATLIKNYQNKKSGKVSVSRNEIQRRFHGMDWKYQKKILLAFINGCDSDREWACRKMFVCWDKSFIPIVKTLWEQQQKIYLSWLILRYFPKDYLKQNMDSLSKGRNYFYLCQRFIDDKDFHIDKNRLYEKDLIELFKISKKSVSDEEIAEVFLSMIGKICRNEYKSSSMYDWDNSPYVYEELSMLSNKIVWNVFHEILFSLGREMLARKIDIWNSKILNAMKESNEYKIIKRMEEEGDITQPLYIELIKKYYLQHLELKDLETEETNELLPNQINSQKADRATQIKCLNELQAENPSFEKLMNSFSLEFAEENDNL